MSIDALYEAFLERLPRSLRGPARSLPFRLRLAPDPGVAWSQVFGHAVTLEAPLLFAEALVGVTPAQIDEARRAHLFSVIGAFGTDRLADGQTAADPSLSALLRALRDARDVALVALCGSGARRLARDSDDSTAHALERERALFLAGMAVDFASYEGTSAGKQSAGMLATVALARAVGHAAPIEDAIHRCLLDIAVGLQFVDDVCDWEDDARSGGAWAVLLAGGAWCGGAPSDEVQRRAMVHDSRVLVAMLKEARVRFAAAADAARALGSSRVAEWARRQELAAAEAWANELRAPGYSVRKRNLGSWAAEVLG
jgi:hypothetical protein